MARTSLRGATHKIRPYLHGQAVPIDTLIPRPGNPRRGRVEAIAASLERFGQTRPILADSGGVIIAGKHTWEAAGSLGWTHVAALLGDLSEEEAAGFMLADNRTSDLAGYDDLELLEALRDVDADVRLAAGFEQAEMDRLELMLSLDDRAEPPPDDLTSHQRKELETYLTTDMRQLKIVMPRSTYDPLIGALDRVIASGVAETYLGVLVALVYDHPANADAQDRPTAP